MGRRRVTTIFLGTVRTELTKQRSAFSVSVDTAGSQLVAAIDRERPTAIVPFWAWVPLASVARAMPLSVIAKIAKSK
jgi:hypothetical protein